MQGRSESGRAGPEELGRAEQLGQPGLVDRDRSGRASQKRAGRIMVRAISPDAVGSFCLQDFNDHMHKAQQLDVMSVLNVRGVAFEVPFVSPQLSPSFVGQVGLI